MKLGERISHATGLTPVELAALVGALLGFVAALVLMMALCD